ncbi:helix-turn-helix domain-containing protein [Carnobacterium maltaromaticum]|uniref:helix-turn-helix domain-containing protein n=1 Tax=Carnobacterium maltaromaticum TaxID=2751 RepID=UPI003B980BBB
MFTAIAELEVENLRARTRAGLNKSTKKGGRKSIPDKVIKEAMKLNLLGEMTNIEIANELEISVTTLYRYLRKERSFCKVSD